MPDDPEVRQPVVSSGAHCGSFLFGGNLRAKLGPEIERLERERDACNQLVSRRLGIAVKVILATTVAPPTLLIAYGVLRRGFGVLTFELLNVFLLALPIALVLGLIFWMWANEPIRGFVVSYKATILSAVAEAAGGLEYVHDGEIPMERLEPSTLIPAHDTYESEDLFRGEYKGVDIELAEAELVRIETYEDDEGNIKTRHIVVFSGLFALFSMNKRFSGRTVIRTDIGALLNWVLDGYASLEQVRLEDPVFEQRFEVFADDQIESRYLLTPAFMERLTAVADDFGNGSMQAAFYDKRLLLMIPLVHDRFEPPEISVSLMEDSGVQRLADELGDVLSIVDALKLDERTGL